MKNYSNAEQCMTEVYVCVMTPNNEYIFMIYIYDNHGSCKSSRSKCFASLSTGHQPEQKCGKNTLPECGQH